MADVITRLKLESGEYDSKVKRATQGLLQMEQECRKVGGTLAILEKEQKQYVQSLGSMQTVSTTVRGKLGELTQAYTELRVQYNRLTEEEKEGDFGKALNASLTQLNQRIQQTKQELAGVNKELNGMDKLQTGGLLGSSKLDGMLAVFGGNVMTKVAGMATGLVTELGDCIKQGVELAKQGEGVRIAFERLGRGDILDGLREATHGTVTDLELMKAAVKFNDFKLPVEELGTMLAFAQQKAKDTGQSVDYMVDSIVTGLGRKSLMILDNLGLSAAEIKERMKETGDMTKAVGAIIRDQMAAAGDYVETAADRAAQANVSLQNKMEELGRKFGPVEEASNQLWTSIKIGILDIIGGPLAELLNGLTEAGRLQNAINNMNGGGNGGPTRIDRMVSMLGDGKSARSRNTYNKQLGVFDERINQQQFRIASLSGNDAITRGLKQKAETELKALEAMRAEYISRANDVFNPKSATPLKTTTDPKKGTKEDKDEFTEIIGLIGNAQEKVSDLQRQISESWDQNEIVKLNEKLKDAQNELDVLTGKLPKDTVADITVDANTADALQKIGDIDGVTIDAKTLTVTADTTEALQRIQKLAADANGTIIEMKVVPVVTDEDIERSLREQYGKPIEVPVVPKTTGETIEQEIRVKLAEQNMDADIQTLRTMLEAQIKNGIEGIEIPSGTLAQAIMGEGVDIPDEYWSNLQDQINEKLKEMDIDPINIDFKTGNIANIGKETEKSWRGAASAMSAAGSALAGLEDPGAKIAGIVGQAIANIALGFSQATAASSGGGVFGWIAAIAGGLTTMLSTISAIHSATGYAQGGIVDGRGGGFVGGMAYSGDNVGNVRLDSGELVLNRSQQNNLANALEGGNSNNVENRQPYVNGELIYLGVNNYLKRTGRGEIVVSKR